MQRLLRGFPNTTGDMYLKSNTPSGVGYGRSTMDVLGALRLVAPGLPPQKEVQHVLAAEGACDPLMYDMTQLPVFEPRTGVLVRYLGQLPPHILIGGHTVHTFDPLEHTDWPDVGDLLARMSSDLPTLAAIATESARRAQSVIWNCHLEDMIEAGAALGALGVVRAHTGSALGWIFPPDSKVPTAVQTLQEIGLTPFCGP